MDGWLYLTVNAHPPPPNFYLLVHLTFMGPLNERTKNWWRKRWWWWWWWWLALTKDLLSARYFPKYFTCIESSFFLRAQYGGNIIKISISKTENRGFGRWSNIFNGGSTSKCLTWNYVAWIFIHGIKKNLETHYKIIFDHYVSCLFK